MCSTATLVSSSKTSLTHCYQDILYTFGSDRPAVHLGGPLGEEVEFAHQAAAVVHQDALVHTDQLHPFSDQRPTDFPAPTCRPQIPLRGNLAHVCSRLIFPGGRIRLIGPRTFAPHRCWCFHLQCFVRSHVIVFMAKLIEPQLLLLARRYSAPLHRRSQHSMESLDFSLCLRMRIPA